MIVKRKKKKVRWKQNNTNRQTKAQTKRGGGEICRCRSEIKKIIKRLGKMKMVYNQGERKQRKRHFEKENRGESK